METSATDFVIDGNNFEDFTGFIREFNRCFYAYTEGGWNGNLDAFNDYLVWPEEKYALIWKDSDKSRQRLGHAEMVKWLEECLHHCHPLSVPHMQERLEAAGREEGQTLFDLIVEIIRGHKDFVDLRLE